MKRNTYNTTTRSRDFAVQEYRCEALPVDFCLDSEMLKRQSSLIKDDGKSKDIQMVTAETCQICATY